MQETKIKFQCPKCEALPNEHGKGDCGLPRDCLGFICECPTEEMTGTHGETYSDPCHQAKCFHCGWEGVFPVPQKTKWPDWAVKALKAGWTPPKTWKP